MPWARPIPLRLVLSLLSAILVLGVPSPAATEPPWLEIHSTHFTVITDAGGKKGREVALRFEQMRAVFASLLTKSRLNQPVPLTILAFKNDKDYYQLAPLIHVPGNATAQPIDVPGFFLPAEDQDFIALNLLAEEPWRAVAYDFAKMLLNYNYPPAQEWFDEGLAEYFSSIRVDNKDVGIGGDPEAGKPHDAHSPASLAELLAAQAWIPLSELFTTKHDTSTQKEEPHLALYNAESWMVMHYLLHEQKLPETGTYFDLVLNQHMIVEDAMQKAYGMTSVQLEQEVKDYFKSQAPVLAALGAGQQKNAETAHTEKPLGTEPAYRFPAPVGPDDSAINSNPMSDADARALYAGVQIRIPEHREFALKELQALATTSTLADKKSEAKTERAEKKSDDDSTGQLPSTAKGNALAHRILAWDHIQHDEFEEAATELGDAAALNRSDMWVRYYLSVLKYRLAKAQHSEISGLPNMMFDLRAVLEWYPEFASAYDLLALARNEGGGPTAAMQAEHSAMLLSPRDERYVLHLAQIYISSKKWDAAEALLERLRGSANPEMATQARERLSQIASERKYGIAGAAVGAQPKLAPQKSPFDVLDEDAAARAAAEKAGQAGGPGDKRQTKFLKGRLVTVDCSTAPSAIVTVAAEGVVLKLRAADYKSLLLIGADEFSCAWQNRQVSVNYKPGGPADGDLVSLEVK